MYLFHEFQLLWRRLGADTKIAGSVYGMLDARYTAPHRKYHSLSHIAHGLGVIGTMRELGFDFPDAVELAFWFHDAEYDPLKFDDTNEKASASILVTTCRGAGIAESVLTTAEACVLATAHGGYKPVPHYERTSLTGAIETMLDVDLAILGASDEEFDEYERGVRFEYKHVPPEIFCEARAALLEKFLARDELYHQIISKALFDKRARLNLQRSIGRLRANIILV